MPQRGAYLELLKDIFMGIGVFRGGGPGLQGGVHREREEGSPDGDSGAADVGAGASAEGEQEVDEGHDAGEHERSRRDNPDDPQVVRDVLRSQLLLRQCPVSFLVFP